MAKPGDHPEFFRFPAPEGRSRESTIRLDGEGRFFHDDEPVAHPKLAAALHTWIARHPDDGRYILTAGDAIACLPRSARLVREGS